MGRGTVLKRLRTFTWGCSKEQSRLTSLRSASLEKFSGNARRGRHFASAAPRYDPRRLKALIHLQLAR